MACPSEILSFKPSIDDFRNILAARRDANIVPVYAEMPADVLTPVQAYLRLSDGAESESFLLESVAGGEKIGRYSLVGADPYKSLRTGNAEEVKGDPLKALEAELGRVKYAALPGLPHFSGGAIGFITYDCVKYFEPRTARELRDPFAMPESHFLFCDTVVVFDHLYQLVKIISHVRLREDHGTPSADSVKTEYERTCDHIKTVAQKLLSEKTVHPKQPPVALGHEAISNTGKEGYEAFVRKLKVHIVDGDIIQAVPSQRLARPTALHPFNVYRQLRTVNPSPYMFYINYHAYQLVGASPEMMARVERGTVYTRPIAGTRRRGSTKEEDDTLAADLLADVKERAEHVMLVDLGRNDVNRVCLPETVQVDLLMHVERYSHVMHIVSSVSGRLRPGKTGFDAFRSIFPAGTVSGAPKVRAMELIAELEGEKRGIYAGAVGHFSYNGDLDTCIAIRTMLFKDGIAYLQAGAGIVHDSVPETEYEETLSKLRSNVTTIAQAEEHYHKLQNT